MNIKTNPPQKWWQNTLDWILWPIMILFFNKKTTHAWHWIKYDRPIILNKFTLEIQGDKNATIVRGLWSQIWAEFWGWRKVVVVYYYYDPSTIKNKPKYVQLGFYDHNTGKKEL